MSEHNKLDWGSVMIGYVVGMMLGASIAWRVYARVTS